MPETRKQTDIAAFKIIERIFTEEFLAEM